MSLVGLVLAGLAVLMPVMGARVLEWYRGRPIVSTAASAILPQLLLVIALSLGVVAILWWSAGRLLACPAQPKSDAVPGAPLGIAAWIAVAVPFAVMTAVLVALAARSFNYDEIAAIVADVRTPFSASLNPRAFINHFSGALLARLGTALGHSEAAVRAPALVVALLGFATTEIVLARVAPIAAFVAGLALALNPLLLGESAQIRGYSAFFWCGAVAIVSVSALFGAVGQRRAWIWTAALVPAALLMGLSHLFGFLWLGALTIVVHVFAWTGWAGLGPKLHGAARRSMLALAAAGLSACLLLSLVFWLPSFPWLFYYQDRSTPGRGFRGLVDEASTLLTGVPGRPAAAAVVGLAGVAASISVYRRFPQFRPLVFLSVAPVAAAFAAAAVLSPTFFYARFLGLGAVLATVVLAIAVSASERLSLRVALVAAVTVAVAGASGPSIASLVRDRRTNRSAARELLSWRRNALDRGGVFATFGGWQAEAVASFYLPPDRVRVADETWWRDRRLNRKPDCLISVDGKSSTTPAWVQAALRDAPEHREFEITRQSPLRCWCYE